MRFQFGIRALFAIVIAFCIAAKAGREIYAWRECRLVLDELGEFGMSVEYDGFEVHSMNFNRRILFGPPTPLSLANTVPSIGDSSISKIRLFRLLRNLDLGHTEIGDRGLLELRSLEQLNTLGIVETKITDHGMKELRLFPALEFLSVSDHVLTSTGVRNLKRIPRLRKVYIYSSGHHSCDLALLRKELPGCEILYSK